LDGASQFSSRAALFVVRGSSVNGWQGRGFSNNEEVKNFALEVSAGPGARVLKQKAPMRATADELDIRFTTTFGPSHDNRVVLIPLLLKERVAAVLYADGGAKAGGQLDDAALEMLVLSSGLWLEIVALRRATGAQETTEAAATTERREPVAVEPGPVEAIPVESAAVAAPAVEAMAAPVAEPIAEAVTEIAEEPAPMAMAATASAGAVSVTTAQVQKSADDDPVHRKAKRFAKLLVDEIKLYNKAKVQEGKKNGDLYQRLKEDIEKSRAAYEKRYGSTAAAAGNYFDREIIQNLAENDSSLLGAGFSR
jgi:hypothetical protein